MKRIILHTCAAVAVSAGASAGTSSLIEQSPDSPGGLARSASDQRVADNFTSPTTTTMTGLTWWGAQGSGQSGDWLIEIYADDGAGGVGASLHEEVISNALVNAGAIGSRFVFETDLGAGVPLASGESYWLSVYRFGGSQAFSWTSSSDGDGAFRTASYPVGPDNFDSLATVFDVAWSVNVPGPGASVAAALLGGAVLLRRRRV